MGRSEVLAHLPGRRGRGLRSDVPRRRRARKPLPGQRRTVVLPRAAPLAAHAGRAARDEHDLRRRLRRVPAPAGRARRGVPDLVRAAAVGDGCRLRDGRQQCAAAEQAPVGVLPGALLAEHTADRGARQPAAPGPGDRARTDDGPGDVFLRLPALGLRLAAQGAAGRDATGDAQEDHGRERRPPVCEAAEPPLAPPREQPRLHAICTHPAQVPSGFFHDVYTFPFPPATGSAGWMKTFGTSLTTESSSDSAPVTGTRPPAGPAVRTHPDPTAACSVTYTFPSVPIRATICRPSEYLDAFMSSASAPVADRSPGHDGSNTTDRS